MKKLLMLFAASLMVMGCEKVIYSEGYPEMESFYSESCGLMAVTTDSVKSFSVKVDDFTNVYPESKEHSLYPKIQENIKSALLSITVTADTTWAGTTTIYF